MVDRRPDPDNDPLVLLGRPDLVASEPPRRERGHDHDRDRGQREPGRADDRLERTTRSEGGR